MPCVAPRVAEPQLVMGFLGSALGVMMRDTGVFSVFLGSCWVRNCEVRI